MFSCKKLLKSSFFLLVCISLISMMSVVASANEAVAENNKTLYLKPNDNWKTEEAWFALYYFDFNDNYACVAMTDEDGDGIYEATLPEGYPNFLFYRMDSVAAEFDGDHVLHQTDCFEYTEENLCYVLAEESWQSGNWEAAPIVENVDTAEDESEGTSENIDATEPTTEPVLVEDPTGESDSAVEPTVEAETVIVTEDAPEETSPLETTIAMDTTEKVDESDVTMPETETRKIYLSLNLVDKDYTWSVEAPEAEEEFEVTEETEEIYSVELPEDINAIVLHGKGKDDAEIAFVEISLDDIQEGNCIVILACDDDVNEFEIKWGIYDPEMEEIAFDDKEKLVIIEVGVEEAVDKATEALDGSTAEETESTKEPVNEEATVDEETESSENTDVDSGNGS